MTDILTTLANAWTREVLGFVPLHSPDGCLPGEEKLRELHSDRARGVLPVSKINDVHGSLASHD